TLNEKHASILSQRRSWWAYTGGDDWRPKSIAHSIPILVRSGRSVNPAPTTAGNAGSANQVRRLKAKTPIASAAFEEHAMRKTARRPARRSAAARRECSSNRRHQPQYRPRRPPLFVSL